MLITAKNKKKIQVVKVSRDGLGSRGAKDAKLRHGRCEGMEGEMCVQSTKVQKLGANGMKGTNAVYKGWVRRIKKLQKAQRPSMKVGHEKFRSRSRFSFLSLNLDKKFSSLDL